MSNGQPLKDVKDIAAGDYFALALLKDGTVYAWGYNDGNGALGQGTRARYNQHTPVQVKGVGGTGFLGDEKTGKIVSISADYYSAVAVTEKGTAYAWGGNDYYKLGTLSGGVMYTPTKVAGVNNAFEAYPNRYRMSILNKDATVLGAGYNNYGELSTGEQSTKSRVQLAQKGKNQGPIKGVSHVAVGEHHTVLNVYEFDKNAPGVRISTSPPFLFLRKSEPIPGPRL